MKPAADELAAIGLGYPPHRRLDSHGNQSRYRGFVHLRTEPGRNRALEPEDDRSRRRYIYEVCLVTRSAPSATVLSTFVAGSGRSTHPETAYFVEQLGGRLHEILTEKFGLAQPSPGDGARCIYRTVSAIVVVVLNRMILLSSQLMNMPRISATLHSTTRSPT